jgi:hypothetical protein
MPSPLPIAFAKGVDDVLGANVDGGTIFKLHCVEGNFGWHMMLPQVLDSSLKRLERRNQLFSGVAVGYCLVFISIFLVGEFEVH